MKKRERIGEKAAEHFRKGFNCSQSVLLAMFEHWNEKNELVPKIATAFGGGIGRCGSVCGALTGGVMAIGIKYGSNEPSAEKRLDSYEIAEEFFNQFKNQNGSTYCRELIGYDLSIPQEYEVASERKVFERTCAEIVRKAAVILAGLTEAFG